MAKKGKDDDASADLPPDVLKQVNDARAEGGEGPIGGDEEELPPEQVAVPPPQDKLSRRAAKDAEREAAIAEAKERASKAEQIAEELRNARMADQERFARMEALLQQGVQRQQTTTSDDDERDDSGLPGWFQKQVTKAKKALAAGDLDGYHERIGKANQRLAQERAEDTWKRNQAKQPQAQQIPQKPAWVTAVESQYPDVVMHPKGFGVVAAFAQMEDGQLSPEKLQKAFSRAREELGLAKRNEETNGARRQMMSDGKVNGGGRGGNGRAEPTVSVPANWREVARANRIPEAEYLRQYAIMNPKDVNRG